ncbi:hypothetical protein EV122DRAFT_252082 [Schizophyllum commune]
MGTISCLLPSSAPFRLPHIRHRQPALDSDTNADELASAVNALPGSPNVTTTGQPNDLLDVKMAPSSQGLASASNVPRGSPMPLQTGSSTTASTPSSRSRDASQVHQCLYVERAQYHGDRAPQCASMSSRVCPMPPRPGSSMIPLASCPGPHDASQVHQYIFGLTQRDDDPSNPMIKLLDLLQQQMLRKSVNVLGSSPNGADTGGSMTPSSLLPHDAMQARQYIATSPNGAVVGQRNVQEDFVIAPWKLQRLKPSPSSGNEIKLRAMANEEVPPKEQRPSRNVPFFKKAPRQWIGGRCLRGNRRAINRSELLEGSQLYSSTLLLHCYSVSLRWLSCIWVLGEGCGVWWGVSHVVIIAWHSCQRHCFTDEVGPPVSLEAFKRQYRQFSDDKQGAQSSLVTATRLPPLMPALNTDTDELASAVNAFPGLTNATATGQFNDLVYFPISSGPGAMQERQCARKSVDVLTSPPNGAETGSRQQLICAVVKATMPRKGTNATASSPNAAETGQLNDYPDTASRKTRRLKPSRQVAMRKVRPSPLKVDRILAAVDASTGNTRTTNGGEPQIDSLRTQRSLSDPGARSRGSS